MRVSVRHSTCTDYLCCLLLVLSLYIDKPLSICFLSHASSGEKGGFLPKVEWITRVACEFDKKPFPRLSTWSEFCSFEKEKQFTGTYEVYFDQLELIFFYISDTKTLAHFTQFSRRCSAAWW